jgi:hypothetical protein
MTMRKMTALMMVAGLGACGQEAAKPVAVETPKAMVAGEYEIASEVTKLASADRSTPATSIKMGDKATLRACVAADGTPDPAMFVEAGDKCTVTNSYGRSGRLSVQYSCQRAGKGEVFTNADGNYTADGFEAIVIAATAFSGDGDYNLTRRLTAKRVGACPAAAAATSDAKA